MVQDTGDIDIDESDDEMDPIFAVNRRIKEKLRNAVTVQMSAITAMVKKQNENEMTEISAVIGLIHTCNDIAKLSVMDGTVVICILPYLYNEVFDTQLAKTKKWMEMNIDSKICNEISPERTLWKAATGSVKSICQVRLLMMMVVICVIYLFHTGQRTDNIC